MGERVIVRQNSRFETEFRAAPEEEHVHDTHMAQESEPRTVMHIHELTPYGMLLASLGGCTAIILHTYAQNHGMALDEVELDLTYDRVFAQDCIDCEEIDRYTEQITQDLILRGDLDEKERAKLFRIAHQCPIDRMLQDGIKIESKLVEEMQAASRYQHG